MPNSIYTLHELVANKPLMEQLDNQPDTNEPQGTSSSEVQSNHVQEVGHHIDEPQITGTPMKDVKDNQAIVEYDPVLSVDNVAYVVDVATQNTGVGLQTHSLIPVENVAYEAEASRSTDNQQISTDIQVSLFDIPDHIHSDSADDTVSASDVLLNSQVSVLDLNFNNENYINRPDYNLGDLSLLNEIRNIPEIIPEQPTGKNESRMEVCKTDVDLLLEKVSRPTDHEYTLARPKEFPFKNTSFPGDGDEDVLPYPKAETEN